MILFLISFLLVFISSYFISSMISGKNDVKGLLYIFLIAFAQIVLTFEILSLFKSINQFCLILFNIIIFFMAYLAWAKNKKPFWSVNLNNIFIKIKNSFKLDKTLSFLFIGYLVFLISTIFLCIIAPITSSDAQTYHVSRSLHWILQGSLNHFPAIDIRSLCLPINSEILYSWVILFVKKDAFLGFFSLSGYILAIISIYKILEYIGVCVRKRLWVIFLLTAFPSVLVQCSSTETDIIIAGLISTSIFLFWNSLKTQDKKALFMSSLAYALAVGTKTPALIITPSLLILFLYLSLKHNNFKSFFNFLSFTFFNIFIFSSYNYILNFIDFTNIFGPDQFIIVSKNYYGLKGTLANFIKNSFLFFDFTGFNLPNVLCSHIVDLRNNTLQNLGLNYIKDGIYSYPFIPNRTLLEPVMGSGILGLLIFLPCMVYSFIKPFCNKFKKISNYTLIFTLIFIINLLLLSYTISFMIFNIRFIMSFMVISSPILIYSYFQRKSFIKFLIVLICLFNLIGISTHLWARPLNIITKMLLEGNTIAYIRKKSVCENIELKQSNIKTTCHLRDYITNKIDKKNKILVFTTMTDYSYYLKSIELNGYKLDLFPINLANQIDFNKYNVVIMYNQKILTTNFVKNDKFPNDLVCYYEANKTIPQPNQYYGVICAVKPNFIKNHNLKLIESTTPVFNYENFQNEYYLIYENLKKQSNLTKLNSSVNIFISNNIFFN